MTLAETQQDFRAWLQAGVLSGFGEGALPGLNIYQNNYRAQLVACLTKSFPHTRNWIGDAAFHDAVVAHIERVPPSSWTLDEYPRDFPETLRLLYPADIEVAELASLESALGDAFVGADAEPVSAAKIAAVDWDQAILRFTPTIDLLEITSNAPSLWSALAAGDIPPGVEMLSDTGALLVWRHDFVSRFRTIELAERHALLLARAGTPFAALCATLVTAHGEADGITLAGAWLGRWLADGLIVDIIQGGEPCAVSRP